MLGWTPDGEAALFYRRERTSGSSWMVAIQDGHQVGEPVLIESDVRVSSIGFSKDAYFFGTQVESQQVHTATIDPSGGGFVADPRPVGDPGTPRTTNGAWSVDGEQLAYVRREQAGRTLIVRAVDGGEERAIPLSTMRNVADMVWAPDGESVLVIGLARARLAVGYSVYRIDLTSGEVTFVVAGPAGLAVARDGQTLYLGRSRKGVVRYDLSSGEETLLHADSVSPGFRLAVSPDGQMIAFTGAAVDPETNRGALNRILVMPTDGRGEAREVFRTEWPHHLERGASIAWTPDGRGVLFVRGEQDKPHVLSRVSADGGPVADIMDFACDQGDCTLRNVQIHPDGRRIAFDLGKPKGEIWMLTGFGVGDAVSMESGGR